MSLRLRIAMLATALVLAACTAAPAAPTAPAGPASTSAPPIPSPRPLAVASPGPSPSPSPSPSPVPLAELTLRLVSGPPNVAHWPLLVADRKGLYQRWALRVLASPGLPPETLLERVATGQFDLGVVRAEAVLAAADRGSALKLVAGLLNKPAYSLIAARDVGGLAELQGKALAVPDPKSTEAGLLERLLAARGLKVGEYSLIALGTPASRVAAVMNGTAAATLVEHPRAAQLVGQRFRSLALASEVAPAYQAEVLAARSDTARSSEGLVRLLQVVSEAEGWLYDPRNKQEAASILAAATGVTPAEALTSYEVVIERAQGLSRAGEISVLGLRTLIDLMGELELLRRPLPDPAQFIDSTALDRSRQLRR